MVLKDVTEYRLYLCIIPAMNKRARKKLKESIEKKNLERQKMLKEQSSASSQSKERRGFTVRPEKKRG